MSGEITKHEGGLTAIQTLRLLMTIDGDDGLAIAKTSVREGMKGLAVRGMSLLQRWNEVRFGEAFLRELEDMRQAGQIREDFDKTDAGVSSVREFFELIDGKPDEARFQAFCALFMSANARDTNPNEAIIDLELMSILRQLSAGEMHLLSAFLKLRSYRTGGTDVMDLLAKELGYKTNALVDKNVEALLNNGLIVRATWKHRLGATGEYRELLTDLAMALVRRIEKYNAFKNSQTQNS